MHLQKLWGKGHCPNDIAEANGTAAQNKANGVRCTYWIDKAHTPCGGTHTWEDHKAALLKFAPPKGKGSPDGKGGKAKGKGKGKSKDKTHSLTEGQADGQVEEGPFLQFLETANWWSGESLSALTEARRSGWDASTANFTLEPERCEVIPGLPSCNSRQPYEGLNLEGIGGCLVCPLPEAPECGCERSSVYGYAEGQAGVAVGEEPKECGGCLVCPHSVGGPLTGETTPAPEARLLIGASAEQQGEPEADGARESLCGLTEKRRLDEELIRRPCRRCV